MKKLLLSFLLVVFYFSSLSAQSWHALGKGISSFKVTNVDYYPQAMVQYNGNIVVGGFFDSAGAILVHNIAQWNGTDWDSLRQGVEPEGPGWGAYAAVFSEAVYHGNLYVGGEITVIPDDSEFIHGIAQWNGIRWDSVGLGMGIVPYGYVVALQVYDNKLYAAGFFYSAGGIPSHCIAQWNGTKWDSVSSGTKGTIDAFAVYNGELYAGGKFDSIGHIKAKNIAKWNDTNWSPVGSGVGDSGVGALAIYNGKLYAGGFFTEAGGVPVKNIAVWDGIRWDSVGGGVSGEGVGALTQFDSVLCVGGLFDSAGNQPANNIACWNGSEWSTIGKGIRAHNKWINGIFALCATPEGLYACGAFDSAGDVAVSNIAVWSNVQAPVGEISTLKVYPNPNNGQFTVSININEICTIEMYNMLGQKLLNQTLQNSHGSNIINFPGEASEVYFYRVVGADGKIIGSGKMLVGK